MTRTKLGLLGPVLALCLAAFPACGERHETKEITESRTVRTARRLPPMAPFDDATRFGMRRPSMPGHAHAGVPDAPDPAAREARSYGWKVPEGWAVGGARPMRLASFSVEERPGIDVSVTVLSGNGGGMVANVNRWRGQMGLPALPADKIAELPKLEVLGRTAPLVEAEGSFTGMDGSSTAGAALLGVIVELEGESLYVKMTGPAAAVRAEKTAFLRFCESLEVKS